MSSAQFAIDEIVAQHQTVYDVYFSQADTTGCGAIGALDAGNFLKHSKLKSDVLKTVWDLSDPTGKGYLDRQSFYIALKLIALSQSGQDVTLENINNSTPAPKLGDLSSNITSLITPDDPWYIKASSRISFDKLFDSLSPINDKITGARVKPFLINSALPVDVLGKIWELSDLDQDGNLDREEFLISMQLVQKAKEGTVLPDQLPPSLLPFKVRHTNNINSPGGFNSSTSSLGSPYVLNEMKPWVVTVEEKAKSDIIFNQIDTEKKGSITGGECKETFIKTGLSQMILANIWNLCDIGASGKLNSEQFALAMHFINKKLATGLDAPPELLPEMIPPSFRKKTTMAENTIESKELEELQLQITELQREKLFYEQRASEHDASTKLKRTELSNLELEMESLFKTLQDREGKKVEEERKLADLEDKLVKIDSELVDLKQKYETEKGEIGQLKEQINHMEITIKNKDNDLNQIKSELKKFTQEQTNIEIKLESRKNNLIEMNTNLKAAKTEVSKNKNKIELLKSLQLNLTKLLKEYENLPVTEQNQIELNNEIKQLEEENCELNKQIKNAIAATNNNLIFEETSIQFSSPNKNSIESNTNAFEADFSEGNFVEDPFQTYDPFKDSGNTTDPFKDNSNTNDPFKDSSNANDPFKDNDISNDPFKEANSGSDPFASTSLTQKTSNQNDPFASDPFGETARVPSVNIENGFDEDPFANFSKKQETAPPPRPAPPRAQTPNLKPAKMTPMTQRPQSSMDFTRNNKFDLFADFIDPFQTSPATQTKIPETDPFAATGGDWNAFGNTSASSDNKAKEDAWDPFG